MNPRMAPEQARTALASMTDADFRTVEPDDVDDALVERLVETSHSVTRGPSLTCPGQHSPQVGVRWPGSTNDRLWHLAVAMDEADRLTADPAAGVYTDVHLMMREILREPETDW